MEEEEEGRKEGEEKHRAFGITCVQVSVSVFFLSFWFFCGLHNYFWL